MENNTEETKVVKTVCMLCFMVCGINAHVKNGKIIKVEGMKEHAATKGVVCPRGIHFPDYVYAPDRLKYPMIKGEDGVMKRVSWDEALDTVAAKLQKIKDEYGAHAIAGSVGSIGAEDILISAFAQRFRGAIGTPNFFSVEAHCFRCRIMGRLFTFGNYPISDIDHSDLLILWGKNPDASEPPVGARIHAAVDKGLKIIAIDPIKTRLAKRGLHVSIRPGTDAALALSMIHVIISEGLYNKEFVEKYTVGFDKLSEHVKKYPPEKVSKICDVATADIYMIARMFAGSSRASIHQGIASLDQHINGFQTCRAISILQAITGNFASPGGWNATQLLRMTDLRIPVDEKPIGAEEYPIFHAFWGRTAPYGQQMLLPETILTEKPYPIKAMIVSGGNPVASWPDAKKLREAFKKLDLLVVTELFMTETAKLADVVLPVCSTAETLGLAYNYGLTMGIPYVLLSRKLIEPIGECKPVWWIYAELGRKMGFVNEFPWKTDKEVVDHMLSPSGLSVDKLEETPEGVFFAEKIYGMEKTRLHTPTGKIELYSQALEEMGQAPLPDHIEPTQSPVRNPELNKKYPLILVTGVRTTEYTNWQFRNIPQLRRLGPNPVAWINPSTGRQYGIVDGARISIETRHAEIQAMVQFTDDMKPGVLGVQHGWEYELNPNTLNELDDRDPVTGYSEFRNIACRIKMV